MTTTPDFDALTADLRAVDELRCNAYTTAVANAHTRGDLDDATASEIFAELLARVPAQNDTIRDLVLSAAEAGQKPTPLHSWDFRGLAPDTLPTGWKAYGPTGSSLVVGGMERWGQNGGRTGWYRGTTDLGYTADGITLPWEPDPRGGLRCGYLTTDYGGPVIPAHCRVEFDGRWDYGTSGLWAAIGWLCASDGGAGRAEVDISEYLPSHSTTGVSHVLHGKVKGATQYNLASKYLGRKGNTYAATGWDWSAPHTHWFEARPVDGTTRLAWGVDDVEMEAFTGAELAAKGVDWTLPVGWTIDVCTESEGNGGGKLDPTYTGGRSLTLTAVRVWDLTGDA